MDQLAHEVRRNQWQQIILECQKRPEGMSAKQWMLNNGIQEKSYYYWQRKLRKEVYAEMQTSNSLPAIQETAPVAFAEIPIAPTTEIPTETISQPAAIIKTADATIAISDTISDRLLSKFFQEIFHA